MQRILEIIYIRLVNVNSSKVVRKCFKPLACDETNVEVAKDTF